jgi:hypothetical protein
MCIMIIHRILLQDYNNHCLHLNLTTFRIWCYKCEGEMLPLNNDPAISQNLLTLFSQENTSDQLMRLRCETQGIFNYCYFGTQQQIKIWFPFRNCWAPKPRKHLLFECSPTSFIECASHDSVLSWMHAFHRYMSSSLAPYSFAIDHHPIFSNR